MYDIGSCDPIFSFFILFTWYTFLSIRDISGNACTVPERLCKCAAVIKKYGQLLFVIPLHRRERNQKCRLSNNNNGNQKFYTLKNFMSHLHEDHFIPVHLLRKYDILARVASYCFVRWMLFRNLGVDIWMAFPQCENENESSNLMVLRMLYCRFGRYSDLVIEERKLLKMERCSDGVAKDSLQMMEWARWILASMVVGIVEEEAFDSRVPKPAIVVVLVALDLNNKSLLIAARD